jgi:hypothetical protein
MKARTTSTQPRSSKGDQTDRAADFIDSIGHEQTSRHVRVMSVIPLKADIHQRGLYVRLVPEADITVTLNSGSQDPPVTFLSRYSQNFSTQSVLANAQGL